MILGVETTDRADELAPILEQWIRAYETASRRFPQTRDAWFIEPTLVGLLANAAWLSGVPAIVESQVQRPERTRPKLDLLLGLPTGAVAIEAKIHFVPYEADAHRLLDQLEVALDEAQHVSHPLAKRYFGLSFVLLEAQDATINLEDVLSAVLRDARERSPRPAALAWVLLDQPEATYRGCVLVADEAPSGAT